MLDEEDREELRDRLKEEFTGYYEKAGGRDYRFHHLESSRKHVVKMIRSDDVLGLDFDEEVVEVAALFHDIGRKEDIEDGEMDPFEGHEGHAERGERIVHEYVQAVIGKKKAKRVREVVGNHHSEAETVEGKIVQDVDLLTNYGVSDLWRMIHYSSENERTMQEAFKYSWNTNVPRYLKKLDDFHFDSSRKWARERLIRHQQTVQNMEEEFNAEDRSMF